MRIQWMSFLVFSLIGLGAHASHNSNLPYNFQTQNNVNGTQFEVNWTLDYAVSNEAGFYRAEWQIGGGHYSCNRAKLIMADPFVAVELDGCSFGGAPCMGFGHLNGGRLSVRYNCAIGGPFTMNGYMQ